MKNLKQEIEKILNKTIEQEIGGGYDFDEPTKQILTLFSKTLDHVIGEDDTYEETSASYMNNNLRNLQRARKKGLGL